MKRQEGFENNLEDFREFILDHYNIINPLITFDGDYIFGDNSFKDFEYNSAHDMLVLNSLVDEKGNNKYQSLIDRKLLFNFHAPEYAPYINKFINPLLVNMMNKEGDGRHLEFSLLATIYNIMEDKSIFANGVDKSEDDFANMCLNYYKELRTKLRDVLKNKEESPYYDDIKFRFDSFNREMTDDNLKRYIDSISKIKYICLCITDLTKNGVKVSEREFRSCYDPDKFILMYCKAIIDNQPHTIRTKGQLDTSFVLISQVMTALAQCGIKNYNPSIKVYDKNSRKIVNYTFKDLTKDYKKYCAKCPDDIEKGSAIPVDDLKELGLERNHDNYEKLVRVLSEEQQKIIETEFEILPKGTVERDAKQGKTTRRKNSNKKEIDPNQVIKRKLVFEETNYVCQMIGKDKFEGYVGFIYENGYVAFEKFYELDGTPAKPAATYIMTKDNFVEFIQKDRPEIIDYIRNTDNPDIIRKYHTENWADNLHKVLASRKPTLETMVFSKTVSSEDIKTRGARRQSDSK